MRRIYVIAGTGEHARALMDALGIPRTSWVFVRDEWQLRGLRGIVIFRMETAPMHPLYYEELLREIAYLQHTGRAQVIDISLDALLGVRR